MSKEYQKRPIKCCNCGKQVAKGELPALVEVKCDKCGTVNDLSQVAIDGDSTKPFADRLKLEKKGDVVYGSPGPELIHLPEADANRVKFPDGFWDGQPVEFKGKFRRRKI